MEEIASHDLDHLGWFGDAKPLVFKSQCDICLNRIRRLKEDVPVCRAFPMEIPADILSNTVDHREPVLGDQGFKFDPKRR